MKRCAPMMSSKPIVASQRPMQPDKRPFTTELESSEPMIVTPRIASQNRCEGPKASAHFASMGVKKMSSSTPKTPPMADAMNPAVLKLISQTAEGAHAHGKWVGVCGGIASDPQAVPILVGLGVDELSVSVPALPSIKAEVRRYSLEECRALAERALASDSAAETRALVPLED